MDTLVQVAQAVSDLQQQLQGLSMSDVNTLNATVQQTQQQVNALAAQVATPAAPAAAVPAAVSAVTRLKPHKPDPYSDTKVSGRPEAWVFTVDTFFTASGIQDPDRVTYVATLLRGAAALWWQSHVRTVAAASRITTWDAFQTAFLEQFAPVSNTHHAPDRLSTLYQTKSVTQYTSTFRLLVLQIPNISADEQLDRYLRGLKHAVRREVEMREPADLQVAMRLADRADALMYRDSASVSRPAAQASAGPVPMDIGAVAGTYRPALPKLTPQERAQLMREGRCFRCRQKGHSARNCQQGNFRH